MPTTALWATTRLPPRSKTVLLFDDLVGASKKQLWDGEAKCLGGLEIKDQLDLRGLLNRQIARLLALANAAGVDASQPLRIGAVGP
jgi:hypothetical protein